MNTNFFVAEDEVFNPNKVLTRKEMDAFIGDRGIKSYAGVLKRDNKLFFNFIRVKVAEGKNCVDSTFVLCIIIRPISHLFYQALRRSHIMRKDNLIDKPTVVSLLGAAVSAALMVAFAIAYRIAGLFVPDTNAVMVAVHGIISLCGNILMFSTIAAVASVIYSKLCDDRAIAERFAKPPKSSAVSSVLTRIAFAAIMICAVGFVIEVVGMSPIAIFLEATGALEAHEAFLHGLEIILSCVCKVSFIVAVLLAFAAYKARWEL